MVAEPSVAMVVLAVDVGRDHPADGDELGARHHDRKPTPVYEGREDVSEENPGLDG
jgi:hypothetical protein